MTSTTPHPAATGATDPFVGADPDLTDLATTTAALAAGTGVLVGRYSVDLATGHWWWSDEVYTMHGYRPGEVEPGPGPLRRHQVGEDRSSTAVEDLVLRGGAEPFASSRRIVDAHGRHRHLLVTGQTRRSPADGAVQVVGYMVDVSSVAQDAVQVQVRRAIDTAYVAAADIERAKGALMAVHGINEDRAQDILVRESGRHGTGLRMTAAQVLRALTAGEGLGAEAARGLEEAFDTVVPEIRAHVREAHLARRRPN